MLSKALKAVSKGNQPNQLNLYWSLLLLLVFASTLFCASTLTYGSELTRGSKEILQILASLRQYHRSAQLHLQAYGCKSVLFWNRSLSANLLREKEPVDEAYLQHQQTPSLSEFRKGASTTLTKLCKHMLHMTPFTWTKWKLRYNFGMFGDAVKAAEA